MTSSRILALLSVSILFGTATTPISQTATNPTPLQAPLTAGGDLRKFLQYMEVIEIDDGFGNMIPTISFHGANVRIVNGSGSTDGAVDGTGNLIVGYNELRLSPEPNDRSGSHNLVVGKEHNFNSFGGLVAGLRNTLSANHSSVSGGRDNTASGYYSSVSGGSSNTASGSRSSVSGGAANTASGSRSSVSGGLSRTVSGDWNWRAGTLFEIN